VLPNDLQEQPAVETPPREHGTVHSGIGYTAQARDMALAVLGHSWGALVALALGLRHPDAVGSLVLASGYYFPTARLDVPLLAGPALRRRPPSRHALAFRAGCTTCCRRG
jgi:pimeloyl-ACP methyl ester carboxylesterase